MNLMLRFIAMLVGAVCLLGCSGAPVQEMSDARQAIAAAQTAGATANTSSEFYAAEAAITRAQKHLEAQEYTDARLEAKQAKRHAGAALADVQRNDGTSATIPKTTSPPTRPN